jgi:hypothetical protein
MGKLTVLRPDKPAAPPAPVTLAARTGAPGVLTVIENGKYRARELLSYLGTALDLEFQVFSKPAASKPIDADEARMLAARSRLVLTGIGD